MISCSSGACFGLLGHDVRLWQHRIFASDDLECLLEDERKVPGQARKVFRARRGKFSVRPLRLRTGVAKCPPYLLQKVYFNLMKYFRRARESNPGRLGGSRVSYPIHYGRWLMKATISRS